MLISWSGCRVSPGCGDAIFTRECAGRAMTNANRPTRNGGMESPGGELMVHGDGDETMTKAMLRRRLCLDTSKDFVCKQEYFSKLADILFE